jgi:hypothetical protein
MYLGIGEKRRFQPFSGKYKALEGPRCRVSDSKQATAPRTASISRPMDVSVSQGLVDEEELLRVEIELPVDRSSPLQEVRTVLLGRVGPLFCA